MPGTQPENRSVVVPMQRHRGMGGQMQLLPLRIDETMPPPGDSADLKNLVQTIDGHVYALKTTSDHPHLPASEFLCYRLAAACNLAVPFSALIELPSVLGEGCGFGSRFEGGVQDPLQLSASEQIQMWKDNKGAVSAILALDHFVGNDDRHRRNFIWRKNYKAEWVPLAIDYSRAFLVRGFPTDLFPLPEKCNTRTTLTMMKKTDMWDGPYAVFALGLLQSVTMENIAHWLDEMPGSWIDLPQRRELMQWWGSDAFATRLQAVFQHI